MKVNTWMTDWSIKDKLMMKLCMKSNEFWLHKELSKLQEKFVKSKEMLESDYFNDDEKLLIRKSLDRYSKRISEIQSLEAVSQ